ncbi:hypothetical protein [Streptomyces avermitilis]|uniref:Uncharacterized protein n=1 Tax=Streptomyces avermitilis TaxID=33903 RepID=A0A4D4M9V5_STRAX|nr:hypothetical protein [Streptomyces avermitilis]GDY68741.1 hypothetical protein SAV14893_081340 [Streptomyces avermitilis]
MRTGWTVVRIVVRVHERHAAEVSHGPGLSLPLGCKQSLVKAVAVGVVDLAAQNNDPDAVDRLVVGRQAGPCCFVGVGHNFLDWAR